jgi:hypothetical protein
MTTTVNPTEFVVAPGPAESTRVAVTMAADVGNARTAVLVQLGDAAPTLVTMPTVRSLDVVFARDVFERRSLPADAWYALAPDEHIVTHDGVDRFLGRLAVDYARAPSSGRGSDARYSDGTTTAFILAGLAAAAPKARQFVVRCATLLPIGLWAQRATEVAASLRGVYHYSYNGRPIEARFDDVLPLREGVAAYAALPQPLHGRAVIVDGGGRTVNVALFNDGVYVDGATIDHMGVEAALDALDRQLELDGVRCLTLAERLELQAAMREGHAYTISHRQVAVRVDPLARRVFDATARTLVQEIRRLVKIEAAQRGAFVGGAAYAAFFGQLVNDALPVLELVSEPEHCNAIGALAQLNGRPSKKARRR